MVADYPRTNRHSYMVARATEPFFTTKEVGKGTGLGLSMAHGFAVQSGGRLAIGSAPGQGTTVTLWLPAAEPEPAAAPGVPAAEAGSPSAVRGPAPEGGAGPRVLLVDDEPGVRSVLAEALREAGFDVALAERAAAALTRVAQAEHFDAVVTDLAMPGMSGAVLVAELARRRPGLPVLLLTGDAAAAEPMPEAPAALLRKPVNPEALVRALRDLLRGGAGPVAAGATRPDAAGPA